MRMWVIMGNDYPHSICSSEKAANQKITELKASQDLQYGPNAVIFWRAIDFEVYNEE